MISFEDYIKDYVNSLRDCELTKAMAYALEGGKRFRPNLIFALAKGMGLDVEDTYPYALALELIQTYSLIHDDLPAMDNDDMRRGKPSLHKAFREDIAILAGDELLTDSFRILSSAKDKPEIKINIINAFSRYAGLDGMIYGQLLDVTNTSKTIDKDLIEEIQDNKTGGLFKIVCLIPMYLTGRKNIDYFIEIGSLIGKIFQNQDDLFDLIKSEEEMGKMKSDLINDKGTALTLYSKDELISLIDYQFNKLDELLNTADFDTKYFKEVLLKLKKR